MRLKKRLQSWAWRVILASTRRSGCDIYCPFCGPDDPRLAAWEMLAFAEGLK